MQNLAERAASIKAVAVAHFDRIELYAEYPPDNALLAKLSKASSSAYFRQNDNELPRRDERYVVWVVAPTWRGLQLLARQVQWRLKVVEIALSIDSESKEEATVLGRFIERHFVQGWHRGDVKVEDFEWFVTRREGKRGINFCGYYSSASKLSGALHSVKLESRVVGKEALKRLGLATVADLRRYDPAEFWHARLKFFKVDVERLGRWAINRQRGQRRRKPWTSRHGRFVYNFDRSAGGIIFAGYGRSIQALVDGEGRGRWLLRLPLYIDIVCAYPP